MPEFKYSIQAGDVGVSYEDEGPWRSYDVTDDVQSNDLNTFLNEISIAEVDQEGGEINCYGFDDATAAVQQAIMAAAGITDEDMKNLE